MNALTTLPGGGMPSVFSTLTNVPDMIAAAQEGIGAGYAALSVAGRVWSVRYRGDKTMVMNAQSGQPEGQIPVVIVGVSPTISKAWYEAAFTPADMEAGKSPDCYSNDGIEPDAGSTKRQSATCALCPKNAFGSARANPSDPNSSSKGKDCRDSRRIAVVPAGDIRNEEYGGPMLLSVPPTSLQSLAGYAREVARFKAPLFSVVTTMGFDYTVNHPQIVFKAAGWVDGTQAEQIVEVLKDPQVERITSGAGSATVADTTSALATGGPPPAMVSAAVDAVTEAKRAADEAAAIRGAKAVKDALAAVEEAATLAAVQAAEAAAAAKTVAPAIDEVAVLKAQLAAMMAAQNQAKQAEVPPPVVTPEPVAAKAPVTVVHEAPSDMEAAIDALLNS